jgi:hypothetical protein
MITATTPADRAVLAEQLNAASRALARLAEYVTGDDFGDEGRDWQLAMLTVRTADAQATDARRRIARHWQVADLLAAGTQQPDDAPSGVLTLARTA